MFLFGLFLSSFFWLPALYESRYINNKVFNLHIYEHNFSSFRNLIYSPWQFGANINEKDGLSAQIGLLHLGFVIVSFFYLIKQKKQRSFFIFWLTVLILSLFLSTSMSYFLWKHSQLLQKFQFPWRFSSLSSFAASVLVGHALLFFNNKKLTIISIIALLIVSMSFVKVNGRVDRTDSYYFQFPATTFYHGEATTIWTEGDATQFPKSPVEIISGRGKITNLSKKSNKHFYRVTANTDVNILDNTVYFPGWQAWVDGRKTNIEFQDVNHRGLITFSVPQGTHRAEIRFGESPIRLFSDIISLGSFLVIMLLFFLYKTHRLRSI